MLGQTPGYRGLTASVYACDRDKPGIMHTPNTTLQQLKKIPNVIGKLDDPDPDQKA